MAEALKNLQLYFSYPFVRYALIVGVLIAVCSSLLGVTLVLKRFSFIGDGLSHVAFGAMAIAAVSLGVELTILGAEAVNKSYPSFFIELAKLGGVTNVL